RVAVVASRWALEPASGSVMAKAIFTSPVASPGSHCFFSSSDPNLARTLPQMAGETIEQQRATVGRHLLQDKGQFADPHAAAAEVLGNVHPEVAGPGQVVPQLRGPAPGPGPLGVPPVPVAGGDPGDRLPQQGLFGRLREAHVVTGSGRARCRPLRPTPGSCPTPCRGGGSSSRSRP